MTANLHAEIVKSCGHPIVVSFDWASFPPTNFSGHAADSIGRMCSDDTLNMINVYCKVPSYASYRDMVTKITTVTCRYKACTELPPASWDRNDGVLDPGYEYALTNNGTNLDKSFCETSSLAGTWDLDRWFRNPKYPVVKKPGSATR